LVKRKAAHSASVISWYSNDSNVQKQLTTLSTSHILCASGSNALHSEVVIIAVIIVIRIIVIIAIIVIRIIVVIIIIVVVIVTI